MHPVDVPIQRTTTGIHASRDWESCQDVFQVEQFHNLISGGISIQYNNTQVSQKIPFHHKMISWKLISEANVLEKEKNASFYGDFDTGIPVIFQNNVCNNYMGLNTSNFNSESSATTNIGASKRIEQTKN